MGLSLYTFRAHRQLHLLSLLLLLISTQFSNSAEGRPLFQLLELSKEEAAAMEGTAMIGSRPPRCEGMCASCGHCEAIQVPAAPARTVTSRGEDSTNYKPLSWKCKCGGMIINP